MGVLDSVGVEGPSVSDSLSTGGGLAGVIAMECGVVALPFVMEAELPSKKTPD